MKRDDCCATASLQDEISKGSSYCAVDDAVKELSFVFVVGSSPGNAFLDKEVCTDSRGSCIDVNLNRSSLLKVKLEKKCVIPAYLIIFELNNEKC